MTAGKAKVIKRDFGPSVRLAKPAAPAAAMPDEISTERVTRLALGGLSGYGPASPAQLQRVRRELQAAQARRRDAVVVRLDNRKALEKEYRRDPTEPNGPLVRGSRVRDPLRRMFETRDIDKPTWDAIEAFRDDVAEALGAGNGSADLSGVRSAMSNRLWPSDERLDAMGRIARTWDKLSLAEQSVLHATVILHRTVDDVARAERMRRQRAGDLLRSALQVVERQYRHRVRVDR